MEDSTYAAAAEIFRRQPLLLVSNREPYEHYRTPEGTVRIRKTVGGLVAALDPLMAEVGGTWIAWGSGSADRDAVDHSDGLLLPPGEEKYRLRRMWLSPEEVKGFYDGHGNQTLWPLCHAQTERVRFRRQEWDVYQQVNRRFAGAVKAELKRMQGGKKGVIWFQDYHFATAPAMVRDALPGATILQFWHIPWPPWEIFRQHPQREAILLGMLGCDFIGMHIDLFCHNFLECVQHELSLPVSYSTQQIILGERTVRVRALPISVDANAIQSLAQGARAEKTMETIRHSYDLVGKKVGIGVERSDYTKGILERLHALELLFELYPRWRGSFTFLQVSAPSRETLPAYRSFQQQVVTEVNRINVRFGKGAWKPIILVRAKQSHAQLAALYRLADLAIVSSLQDGMNLVAKEYIACNTEETGTLVLSEFAGASEEIPQAFLINPYDVEGFAHAIHQALLLTRKERSTRMRQMRHHLFENTIFDWMMDIAHEIEYLVHGTGEKGNLLPLFDHLDAVQERMQGARHIALFCDYDGVLAPIAARPEEAEMHGSARDLLIKLRDSATVRVSIISGRSIHNISELVGIKRLTYAGNHGLEISGPKLHRLHPGAASLQGVLRKIYDVLRTTFRDIPGVIVEDKELSLTVHYRLAAPEDVPDILERCYRVVQQENPGRLLRSTTGKRVFEIRPNVGWDKGKAVLWILESLYGPGWRHEVLPVYLGDDETDEDAFRVLKERGIGIIVSGEKESHTLATYNLAGTGEVPLFLDWLNRAVAEQTLATP